MSKLLVSVLLALASAPTAQGIVWIVDDDGGPGVDFTEIQPAVDAAADGDTIVVRSGFYNSVTIDGKTLVVTNGVGAVVRISSFTVRNLGPGQVVTVRGVGVILGVLELNAGSVWLESVSLGRISPPCLGLTAKSASTLKIVSCAAVVVTRGSIYGGGESTFAHEGILGTDSSLYLFETDVFGGMPVGLGAFMGADAVHLTNTFLFASGCTFTGGCGSRAFGPCGVGGDGGAALWALTGPRPQLLDTALVGGTGNCALDFPFCGLCGLDGPPAVGGFDLLSGFARDYVLDSPGIGGQTTTLVYQGVPGDFVFSLVGLGPAPLYLPALAGTLVLPIPPLVIPHGAVDASGALVLSVPLPLRPPGVGAVTIYAQAAAVSPVGAAV
ncbi:MAG: hypothetical protein ACE5GW_07010, partial [Planctomycetota bacterium]